MIIDALTALPSTPTTGDELPIERGTTTYKIDYDALATAIINKLGTVLKPSDVIDDLTSTVTDKPLSAAQGTALASKTTLFSATSSTSLTPITEGMSVSLSNSLNNYMFLLFQLSTSASNGTSYRGVLMVPAYSVDSNSYYAVQVGSTFGYIRLGDNSGNLKIYSFGGFSELYLYRVIGVMQIA